MGTVYTRLKGGWASAEHSLGEEADMEVCETKARFSEIGRMFIGKMVDAGGKSNWKGDDG